MSLYKDLTDKIYDYLYPLAVESEINTIIFDYGNGVEINGDFIAIDIIKIQTDHKPEVVYKPKAGGNYNEEFVNYRGTLDIAIDIYSKTNAIFIAEELKAGLYRGESHDRARVNNLGLVSYGDTLNLTATQDGKYRNRAQFNLLINFTTVHTKEDTTIGTVTVKGDLDEGKYFIDETITESL